MKLYAANQVQEYLTNSIDSIDNTNVRQHTM